MILTQRTVEVIKNFAAINPNGMVWPVGNIIRIAPPTSKTMLVEATIEEDNADRFVILDLMQFYSALSSFDKPEVELDGVQIRMSDAGQFNHGTFILNTASEQIIKEPSTIKFPEEDTISFELDQATMSRLFKGIGIIAAPKIAIKGDGSEMYCVGYDPDNSGMNQYKVPLASTSDEFTFIFEIDHVNKLMKGMDYTVSISRRGIARFQGDRITYYVASKTLTT